MGEIVVEVELQNEDDRAAVRLGFSQESEVRRTQIRAVADTGAMMLALPKDVVDELGLPEMGSMSAKYADGRREPVPLAGPLTIRIGDRSMVADWLVLPLGADPLVGQIVMERLDLIADCTHQTLTPRPESPDRPLVRL